MEMRHGRNKAETEPIARGAAATLKPVETLENVRELIRWDARSIVGDGDQRVMFERPHRHRHQPVLFPVFDGIIDEIATASKRRSLSPVTTTHGSPAQIV